MLALIQSKYVVNKVVIDQFYVNLYNKEADSTYNYQFILDAFKSKETVVKETDTTQVLNFKIKDIDITHTQFKQKDYYLGMSDVYVFNFKIQNLSRICFFDDCFF